MADYGVGKDQCMQGMWEYCSFERTKAKKFLKDAEKEKQEGIQGQWQQEAPAKEYLEQVKRSAHTDCTPRMMKFGYFALKDGDWEGDGIMLRSTDFLRRIIAPGGGQGGVTMSYLWPNCNSFPLEDYMWWVSAGKKHTSWWCAICGENYEWRAPNRSLTGGTNR